MSEATWTVLGVAVVCLILLGTILAMATEMRHRTRELSKLTAVTQPHLPWWQVLELVLTALEPLPDADTTKLRQALNGLQKIIPTHTKESQ